MKKSEVKDKLKTLGTEARFDLTGPAVRGRFIYPAVGKRRCINLFKVLQSNFCQYNCLYCGNRKDKDSRRFEFSPKELARTFLAYYKRRVVRGLFLSSGVYPNPDEAQEKMLKTIQILRRKYGYAGYIHCKVLPGVDEILIERVGKFVDRLSLNIEVPSQKYLSKISLEKNFTKAMQGIRKISKFNENSPLRAGITTQLVTGGAGESDREILSLSDDFYKRYKMRRIYYSGFRPIENTPLENQPPCPDLREARLYQADFLLREYGFSSGELIFNPKGNLIADKDPKLVWAMNNPEEFPVEINRASFRELIRVPGIGKVSAGRILRARRGGRFLDLKDLEKFGVVLKRARDFITVNGKFSPSKKDSGKQLQLQYVIPNLFRNLIPKNAEIT